MSVKIRLSADDLVMSTFFAGTGNADIVWAGIREHAASGALPTNLGGTSLSTLAAGDLIYADSTSSFARIASPLAASIFRTNGAGVHSWATKAALGWVYNYKTVNTDRDSTTTPTADPQLTFTVTADQVWHFRFTVFVECESETPGMKFGLTGPASPTSLNWFSSHVVAGATDVLGASGQTTYNTDSTVGFLDSGVNILMVEGVVENGSNAGSLAFNWAQAVSDTDATIVKRGSFLNATLLNG